MTSTWAFAQLVFSGQNTIAFQSPASVSQTTVHLMHFALLPLDLSRTCSQEEFNSNIKSLIEMGLRNVSKTSKKRPNDWSNKHFRTSRCVSSLSWCVCLRKSHKSHIHKDWQERQTFSINNVTICLLKAISKGALTHNSSKEWFWGFGKNGRARS